MYKVLTTLQQKRNTFFEKCFVFAEKHSKTARKTTSQIEKHFLYLGGGAEATQMATISATAAIQQLLPFLSPWRILGL